MTTAIVGQLTDSLARATANLVPAGNVFMVPVDRIEPNPFQPREPITPESLEDLAGSLREHGVLQPSLLRPHPDRPGWFQMVSGERRWRATMQIGRAQLPCVVQELDDVQSAEIALQENIQRETLSDFEEARGLWKLWMTYETKLNLKMSKREMARRMNKSVSFITNRLDTLGFHEEVQDLLKKHRGVLSVANAINDVNDYKRRAAYIKRVELQGASLRDIQAQIKADDDVINADGNRLKAARAASQAPDSQTKSRSKAVESGGSGSMSRGRQLTSDNQKTAHEEGMPALQRLETWTQFMSPNDYKKVQAFAHRVLEGDLARK